MALALPSDPAASLHATIATSRDHTREFQTGSTSVPFSLRERTELGVLVEGNSNPASCSAPCRWPSRCSRSGPCRRFEPAVRGFTPAQIQQAYQFNQVSFNGSGTGGETIAIVDAYNDPNIQSDLNTFDTQFSLPSTTVSVVNETGGSSLPAADSTGGWELEESLDVEWAHAMAPGANIMLVEASSADDSDLLAAVSYAAQHANVVSMSWGGGEFSGETSYDSYFSKAGVAFVAASGDSGAPISWPAASPNVLAVGGTTLTLDSSGGWGSETGWSGSSGGPSAYEPQPSYQAGVVTTDHDAGHPRRRLRRARRHGLRRLRLVSLRRHQLGWVAVCGTSAGAPQWSAILAIADQGRAANSQSALNSSSAQQVMDILYQNPGDFHDITSGTSTGNPEYSAGPGYDYVTGLGTPMVNLVVGSLDGTTTTPPDTHGRLRADQRDGGQLVHLYRHRRERQRRRWTPASRGRSASPAPTARSRACQALTRSPRPTRAWPPSPSRSRPPARRRSPRRATSGSVTSTITVSPAAASKFVISGLSTATVGTAESFTVTAEDAYGNVATGYTGTVSSPAPTPRRPCRATHRSPRPMRACRRSPSPSGRPGRSR